MSLVREGPGRGSQQPVALTGKVPAPVWIADRYREWRFDRLIRKVEAALERNADLHDRFADLLEERERTEELLSRSRRLTGREGRE